MKIYIIHAHFGTIHGKVKETVATYFFSAQGRAKPQKPKQEEEKSGEPKFIGI